MHVIIDGWAWLPTDAIDDVQRKWLTDRLTLLQRVSKEYQNRVTPAVLRCYTEDKERGLLGIPREFFFEKVSQSHDIEYRVTNGQPWPDRLEPEPDENGNSPGWTAFRSSDPKELTFYDKEKNQPAKLINEQPKALTAAIDCLTSRPAAGCIVQAPTGWGKTIWALALIKTLRLKTAILCHREFLMGQWKKKINSFLPDAKVGIVFGKKWKVDDCHIVLVSIETLASWAKKGKARPELAGEFGLVVTDETHRAGAPTWASAIPLMHAAKRVGVSARPKRSDGLDKSFFYNIGPRVFAGTELRLTPRVRRVWTEFRLNEKINPAIVSKEMVTKFLARDRRYNAAIVDQLVKALSAGRKILVYSHSKDHLVRMRKMLHDAWEGPPMTSSFYVGSMDGKKMKDEDLAESEKANVIFATFQMCLDSLDIPPLDTVFLTTPVRNPEQPAGRILRPFKGKKDPVVVDFRADLVPVCKDYAESRDRVYEKLYGDKPKSQV